MPLLHSPRTGEILMCDFSTGFKEPEMIKRRPVVIIGTRPNGHRLATVLCFSTQKPEPLQKFHMEMDVQHLPSTSFFRAKKTWLKGDMIYTVSFERLDYIRMGTNNGKRIYFKNRLSRGIMKEVYACHLASIGLFHLREHI